MKVPEEAVEGDEAGIYLSIKCKLPVVPPKAGTHPSLYLDCRRKESWYVSAVPDEPLSTEHEIEWAEFVDPDSALISWIPEAARRQQLKQRELAQQKGKQVLGGEQEDLQGGRLWLDVPRC